LAAPPLSIFIELLPLICPDSAQACHPAPAAARFRV